MYKGAISDDRKGHSPRDMDDDTIAPALVLEELRRIITSRYFRTSRRGKEFLQYVVSQKISGNGDLLKERLIGVQIFGRKPDYATGEDPVVRVQAGDVRRRLERYNAEDGNRSDILIQIPLGCYSPVFQFRKDVQAPELLEGQKGRGPYIEPHASEATHALPEIHEPDVNRLMLHYATTSRDPPESGSDAPNAIVASELAGHSTGTQPGADSSFARKHGIGRSAKLTSAGGLVLACLALVFYLVTSSIHKSPAWALKTFWLPASVSAKPVLLFLPRPMVYAPSKRLFDRYTESHPNALVTREARRDQILPLAPTDTIEWGDMIPSRNSGPGIGGVIAAVNISKLLTEQGIRFNLRFGDEASYAEMRDSPVVIVGGINTDWVPQLTSGLNFVFDETPAAPNIHETGGAKRVWKMETSDGQITRDYGLITRQLTGKAGQFLVQVAGVSQFGTEAASEFLANKQEFATALRSESISLQKKNLQIVVSTDVTDGRAGPAHIVAISSW